LKEGNVKREDVKREKRTRTRVKRKDVKRKKCGCADSAAYVLTFLRLPGYFKIMNYRRINYA
jgi:hypothetical protein